jgi:hypothetical protein
MLVLRSPLRARSDSRTFHAGRTRQRRARRAELVSWRTNLGGTVASACCTIRMLLRRSLSPTQHRERALLRAANPSGKRCLADLPRIGRDVRTPSVASPTGHTGSLGRKGAVNGGEMFEKGLFQGAPRKELTDSGSWVPSNSGDMGHFTCVRCHHILILCAYKCSATVPPLHTALQASLSLLPVGGFGGFFLGWRV